MIPTSSARTKSWIAAPPNRSSARSVRTTVRLVMIDRPKVCRIEWLTIWSRGSPRWRALFSRTRSNTTIVSWTLNPMIVSIAVTNNASIWTWKNVPRIAKIPTTTMTSWTRATRAVTPNFTSRNRYVIHSRIPSDPTRMRINAWLMRSELTTGPTVVRLAWDSIGPSAACRAVTMSPSLPVCGSCDVPAGAADGAGLVPAAGDALAPGEALAAGEALVLGAAVGLGDGLCCGDELAMDDGLATGDDV